MAVNKVDFPTAGAPVATSDYVKTLSNLAGALTGKGYIPITNFGTTSTPQIAQSALFVAGGVLYQADANTSISGTMAAESYIEMVPSGSPSGATLTPTWTTSAPTWSAAYNHFISGSSNLVLHIMRDQDGYNSFLENYDFIDVSANSTTPLTALGNLADMFKRHSVKGRWSAPTKLASGTVIAGIGAPSICKLDENNGYCVLLDSANDVVQTYKWNGSTFTTVGNTYAYSVANDMLLARLTDTTIAASNGTTTLRKLSFDGTDWSLVGNSYTYGGTGLTAICELEDNRIAFFDSSDSVFGTLEFDGTDWSITYSDTYTESGDVSMAKLGINRVAIFGTTTDDLTCLEFDGSNWAEIGTPLNLSGERIILSSLTNNHIITHEFTSDFFRVYAWTGSTFAHVGNYSLSGITYDNINPAIAVMNGTDFAFFAYNSGGDDTVTMFRLGFSLDNIEVYD